MPDSNANEEPESVLFQKVAFATFTDGTLRALLCDDDGKLEVTGSLTANIEGDYVDDSAFTVGTDRGLAVGGIATSDTVDSGDFGVFKMNTNREQVVAQGGTWNINNISGTVSLPTGAATEVTLATLLTETTFTTRINTQGQKAMAASTPVVIASDQSAIPASQSGTWNINNISGTISLPTGAATEVTLATLLTESIFTGRFPAVAALADATTNPTISKIGSFPHWFNGTTWDRARGDTKGAYIQGDVAAGTAMSGNPLPMGIRDLGGQIEYLGGNDLGGGIATGFVQPVDAALTLVNYNSDGSTPVTGVTAHDSPDDAFGPIKTGGRATDYEPDTEDEQGAAEVDAADAVRQAYNLRGETIEGVNSQFHLFDGAFPDTGLDGEYTSTNTNSTSESVECWNYRIAQFSLDITKTGTPTDLTIEAEESQDNTNFTKMMNGGLGAWIYDDTAVGGGIKRSYIFLICSRFIRFKITGTGLGAVGVTSFTVDNSRVFMRN